MEDEQIRKISFYTKTAGYIAFKKSLGFTEDGGRTIEYRDIKNVDYNGHAANLTFGFAVSGVVAFDKNSLLVYGDYGAIPAILISKDGGSSYKLIYHTPPTATNFSFVLDMVFPGKGNVGYAAEENRIIKSTDKGQTWDLSLNFTEGPVTSLEAVDQNTVFAISGSAVYRTVDAGSSWTRLKVPPSSSFLNSAYAISSSKIWLNVKQENRSALYFSSDAGLSWLKKDEIQPLPTDFKQMKFFDENLGFAIAKSTYQTYKTIDGGKFWELLPRGSDFKYLSYGHQTMEFWDESHFWVGGDYGLLEGTDNGGGVTLPRAYFRIDTAGLAATDQVKLVNLSKTNYSYQWFRNDSLIGNTYHLSIPRHPQRTSEKIKLLASNGSLSSSFELTMYLPANVYISKFLPVEAASNETVTITGSNFSGIKAVSFGGVNAASFTVVSPERITARVGVGASGAVKVTGSFGSHTLHGFTYIRPPVISSFFPLSAHQGDIITIEGDNFLGTTSVTFGDLPVQSFQIVSAKVIKAVLGAGNSGAVTISTRAGRASLTGFKILPRISDFMPKSGTNGERITITGSGFTETTAVQVGNTSVKSFTVNNPSSLTVIVGAATSGDVVVTTAAATDKRAGFQFFHAPKISSVSAQSGPVGSSVTIKGVNFGIAPEDNIVRFGDIIAKIQTVSPNSITVIVPPCVNYRPITVTTHGLIATSDRPFITTYEDGNSITANTFKDKTSLPLEKSASHMLVADLDDDGTLDFIVQESNALLGAELVVYKTNINKGKIELVKRLSLHTWANQDASFNVADIDGDGRKDILLSFQYQNEAHVFINTTSKDQIAFDKVQISNSGWLSLADLDLDGKTDLVGWNFVRKNRSSPGHIFFDEAFLLNLPIQAVADLDGDGYPDILGRNGQSIDLLKNRSSLDKFAFTKEQNVPTQYYVENILATDIDGDQKLDIVAAHSNSSKVAVFRNTGYPNFSFDRPIFLESRTGADKMVIADLDGDGKVELNVYNKYNGSLQVFKNLTEGNLVKFSSPLKFNMPMSSLNLSVDDLDGDDKPEFMMLGEDGKSITVYKNTVRKEPFLASFSPSIADQDHTVTIKGRNLNLVTSVSFGDKPAASFKILSDSELSALVGEGSSGVVTIRSTAGSSSLAGFSFGTAPLIKQFEPLSALPGASITLRGDHFGTRAADLEVYFGMVKGQITAVTPQSIIATVPNSAPYGPVSVTRRGLTGYSPNSFMLATPGSKEGFTNQSFSPSVNYHPGKIAGLAGDFDGDGKVDLIDLDFEGFIRAYRNTTEANVIAFAPALSIPALSPMGGQVGDLDGDGKLDLIIENMRGSELSLYRNNSSPQKISFDARHDLNGGGYLDIGSRLVDLDGDGRPEVVSFSRFGRSVYLYQNLSSPGKLAFADRRQLLDDIYCNDIALGDLEGDGKPDLFVLLEAPARLCIYKNVSVGTDISFEISATIPLAENSKLIRLGDIDGDLIPDVLISSSKLTVFRSIVQSGSLNFAAPTSLNVERAIYALNIADFDGDGKADIAKTGDEILTIYRNTGSQGLITFADPKEYPGSPGAQSQLVADIDGDGKQDIVHISYSATFIIGTFPVTKPVLNALSPEQGVDGDTITLTGINLTGVTAVSFGGVPAASFKIISPTKITAVLAAGNTGKVRITSAGKSYEYLHFLYLPPPVLSSFSPKMAATGETVRLKGKYFTGATRVTLGWPVRSFAVLDDETIDAVVYDYITNSDRVEVITPNGSATLDGFSHVAEPYIIAQQPAPYYLGSKILLTASTVKTLNYQWARDGVDIPGATNQEYEARIAGVYTVAVVNNGKRYTSSAHSIKISDNLPQANFKIKVINETCKSSNNGVIEIETGVQHNYKATVLGSGYNQIFSFQNELKVSALHAGAYNLCITIEGYPSYKQCYDLVVKEPNDIVLFASVVKDQSLTLSLQGAQSYNIVLNGKTYRVESQEVTLPMSTGENKLSISSDLPCQGSVEKTFQLADQLKVYPNPFYDTVNIQISPTATQSNMKVEVYDTSGKPIYMRTHPISMGHTSVDLSMLNPGLYLLKATVGNQVIQSKIVKK